MKEYDVIIIGSGAGRILSRTRWRTTRPSRSWTKGPSGGTCLNVG